MRIVRRHPRDPGPAPHSIGLLLALTATAINAGALTAQDVPERQSTAADRESVSLTVYNQNFGLVREIRDVELGSGVLGLEFADVASLIQPETVHIRSLDGGGLSVLEQNYRYDLLNPQKLLEKYVGRTVNVHVPTPDRENEEVLEAEVLAVNGGPILRIGDRITYNVPGRLSFPEVPDDLIASPALVWLLQSDARRQRVEASYLTGGLNWKADYVMVLDEDDRRAGITGWVTLTNQSGATYENAALKLVAGDVQRVSGRRPNAMELRETALALDELVVTGEQPFFEYHMYTLGRPTTLRQNEQKQVRLLESPDFGVQKRLIFHGTPGYYRGSHGPVSSNQKVGVYLDIENAEENGLGMPLPAGIVRVYKRDDAGGQQFVGEDWIDHSPRDETLRIKVGEAFDVIGDRRQMDYTVVSSCVSESSWEIDVRNHKDEATAVELVEPAGGDWTILSSSHEAVRVDAHTFRFVLRVAARGEETVTYRVRVRWC